jgi:hypothetical protein
MEKFRQGLATVLGVSALAVAAGLSAATGGEELWFGKVYMPFLAQLAVGAAAVLILVGLAYLVWPGSRHLEGSGLRSKNHPACRLR